jgi:hypothetical protein
MYRRITPKYVISYLLLFTIVILLYQLPLYKKTFAESPSFGYQKIRDELFDIIDMNTSCLVEIVLSPNTNPPVFAHSSFSIFQSTFIEELLEGLGPCIPFSMVVEDWISGVCK